ncbi:RES family NAD+ phosphorylase [Pseudomonas fragi]|uniref:RES domain-containing protein n=1 Tax=Pseudomonas fragi TaxID=296 RepID=UPI001473CFCD|nr:RES domain-containing protein [Pseudomonas fragi]NNB60871.1 RES family NAD+ phosphorylase [Pseudomonas fragi]
MICVDCVTPAPLKKLFDIYGAEADCRYCGRHGQTIESKRLFDYVYERVAENVAGKDDLSHYELGLLYECGSDFIDVSDIGVVLSEWFDLGEEPYFDDLYDGIPREFSIDDETNETHFYGDDGTLEQNFYEERWKKFVDDVRYKHRYFNTGADKFLDSVFSLLVTDDSELKPEVVRTFVQGELLYRARLAQNQKQAEEIIGDPAGQFGPTPRNLASSQRMTPNGISALYCALERETCLSEIRSITGDHVVSAALTPISELKLLDLTALDRVEPPELTLLDEGARDSLHRKVFLGSLVKKMSRPKARNDELSYLSTQVVFEYLRLRFGKYVDGLVFPSVQTGEVGINVVLFPEASRLSYVPPTNTDPADGPVPKEVPANNPFGAAAKLVVVADSIRFHKVMAIETKAKEYDHIYGLFMSELNRRRLGPIFD